MKREKFCLNGIKGWTLRLAMVAAFVLPSSAMAQEGAENGAQDATEQDAPDGTAQVAGPQIDEELDEAARITFNRARAAFDSGDYETALTRFRQAYELSPRPTLLYNIAATLDRLRRDEETADMLRQYLEAVPDAPDRVEIEARLNVLDNAIAERRQAQDAAAAEAAARQEEEDARRRAEEEEARRREEEERRRAEEGGGGLHPAIAFSVGGAALVAGGLIIWSGLDASSKNDDYEEFATSPGATLEQAEQLFDDTRSAERRTNALIGVAAGLGVASAVLFIFTDFGGDEDDTAVSVGPTQGGLAMSVGGTFR
ncbi:MAG: hypothetical protein AAF645_21585 [Myxococcota bacterium]